MTTAHPRIQVTPNDELLAALTEAAGRWPGVSRSELVLRLALDGARSAAEHAADRASLKLAALELMRRVGDDHYDPDELAALRADWPA